MISTLRVNVSQIAWTRFLAWLSANAIVFGLIAALFHDFPLAFDFPDSVTRLGEFDAGAAIFGMLLGAIPALLIGIAQTIILRRYLPVSRWWILSPALSVGFVHFLGDGFPDARDLTFAVILSGLVLGIWQARLLTRHSSLANWFGVTSAAGWVSGWVIAMIILDQTGMLWRSWTPALGLQQHGLQGFCVGMMYAILTGLILFRQFRRNR